MPTIQVIPTTATINGTNYTQLILTPLTSQHKQSKTILPKQEPLSPKSDRASLDLKVECPKRRIHFSKKALTHPRPQSITRRNTRERNRIRAVNEGFVTLANHVPSHLRSKKMSKVDTLKAAIDYIQKLQEALDADNCERISDSDSLMESCLSPTSSTTSHPSSPLTTTSSQMYSLSPSNHLQTIYPSPTKTSNYLQPTSPPEVTNPPQYNTATHSYQPAMEYLPSDSYQLPCTQFHSTSLNAGGLRIDYTRPSPTAHISPTGSFSSSYSQHHSSSAESDILEMVSAWLN